MLVGLLYTRFITIEYYTYDEQSAQFINMYCSTFTLMNTLEIYIYI